MAVGDRRPQDDELRPVLLALPGIDATLMRALGPLIDSDDGMPGGEAAAQLAPDNRNFGEPDARVPGQDEPFTPTSANATRTDARSFDDQQFTGSTASQPSDNDTGIDDAGLRVHFAGLVLAYPCLLYTSRCV